MQLKLCGGGQRGLLDLLMDYALMPDKQQQFNWGDGTMSYGSSAGAFCGPRFELYSLYNALSQEKSPESSNGTEVVGITSSKRVVSKLTWQSVTGKEKGEDEQFADCEQRLAMTLRHLRRVAIPPARRVAFTLNISIPLSRRNALRAVVDLLLNSASGGYAISPFALQKMEFAFNMLESGNGYFAYLQLNEMVSGIARDESPVEYDLAVLKMAELFEQGVAVDSDINPLYAKLDVSIKAGNRKALLASRHLKALARSRVARLYPGGQYRLPIQWSGYDREKRDRFLALVQAVFFDEMIAQLRRFNKNVSLELLSNMDYRVEPEPSRVRQELRRAIHRAVRQQGVRRRLFECRREFDGYTRDQGRGGELPPIITSSDRPLAHLGVASCIGRRKNMEDTHLATTFTFNCGGKSVPAVIVAVFDGHSLSGGGERASMFVAERIVGRLQRRLAEFNPMGKLSLEGVWNALTLAPVDLARDPFFYQPENCGIGTMANMVLLIDKLLWVVNVGDCRAVVLKEDGSCMQLSEDARAMVEKENGLIDGLSEYGLMAVQRGGFVNELNGRVHSPGQTSSLAAPISLGDVAMGGAVSARPSITCFSMSELVGGTLVQCCDGVFDVASSDQVAKLVGRLAQQGVSTSQLLAEEIVRAGYLAGSTDNMTALVVPLAALQSATGKGG